MSRRIQFRNLAWMSLPVWLTFCGGCVIRIIVAQIPSCRREPFLHSLQGYRSYRFLEAQRSDGSTLLNVAQCCSIHSKPVISAFRDVAPSTPRKEDSCILSMVASASVTVHVVVQSGPWCQTTTNIIKRQTSRASQQSNLKILERSNETLGPMLPDVPTPKTACKMSIP